MVIAHNIEAMNANRQIKIVAGNLSTSTQKLSSGYKINKSADNAAGLGISEKMRAQIRGLYRGAYNIEEGVSYCQVADGALNEMHEMLQRLNELSVQAANGLNSKSDRQAIDDEVQAIKSEMDRICETTKFNDQYIFKCEDKKPLAHEVYSLDYYGMFTDVEIYNDTCTITPPGSVKATYGGIVYQGQRISWDAIDPRMYDTATGKFHAGTYSMIASDGKHFTFACEEGATPPKMKMQGILEADKDGILIDTQKVSWKNVLDSSNEKFDPDNIKKEEYRILYNGVSIRFTPQEGDSFEDVISKLTGCKWEAEYSIPHEETAVFADFADSSLYIKDTDMVKAFIDSNYNLNTDYEIKADNTGMWIKDTLNGLDLLGSYKSWSSMGFTNWGNGSTDISEEKEYCYNCNLGQNADDDLEIIFHVKNEISVDSLAAAFDGTKLKSTKVTSKTSSVAEIAYTQGTATGIKQADTKANTIVLDTEEEYYLGRDFSNLNTYQNEQLNYDSVNNKIGVTFSKTVNGVSTQKIYSTENLDVLTDTIATAVGTKLERYYQGVFERYVSGAAKPEILNLSTLLKNKVTGGGSLTYQKDVLTIDANDPNMKTTWAMTEKDDYASAYMDFAGLGTDYQLGDLVGLGYNSSCQTCNSVYYTFKFGSASQSPALPWTDVTINGITYKYAYEIDGKDRRFTVDVDSMANITNGVDLTNAIVDIINASPSGSNQFKGHFTQYATEANGSKLYLYDYRSTYVKNGVSTATQASFEPFTYGFNTLLDINLKFADTANPAEYISSAYSYDYADILQDDVTGRLTRTRDDANGKYIFNTATNKYEKYVGSAAQSGLPRYNITAIDKTVNAASLRQLIKDKIYTDIAKNTKISLKPTNYLSVNVTGQLDNSDNVVMITDCNRPKEVRKINALKKPESTEFMRIQCSANTIDQLVMERFKLSVYRLGLEKLNVRTQSASDDAINMVARALQQISKVRSRFGAYQNRLEHSFNSNLNTHENTTASESRIRDTEMDEEMVNNASQNILIQTGQSLLAQTKQSKQGVMELLG